MAGKTVLVTGASGGIGKATALVRPRWVRTSRSPGVGRGALAIHEPIGEPLQALAQRFKRQGHDRRGYQRQADVGLVATADQRADAG